MEEEFVTLHQGSFYPQTRDEHQIASASGAHGDRRLGGCTGGIKVMPLYNKTLWTLRASQSGMSVLGIMCLATVLLLASAASAQPPEMPEQSRRPIKQGNRSHRAALNRDADVRGGVAGTPLNDECDSAFTIIEGVTPFTTIGATTDGPEEAGCNFIQGTNVGQDIWYEHVATCTGNLTVSLCNNTDYDSRLAVYDGCGRCPQATGALGCDDDDCPSTSLQSEVVVPVTQGSCYRIRVGGFSTREGTGEMLVQCDIPPPPTGACCGNVGCMGTMTEVSCDALNGNWFENESCGTFSCPPPSNDLCGDAVEVFRGVPYDGFTGGATGDDITQLCPIEDGGDVWHLWTADCTGTTAISLCDSPAPFDTTLSVFDACDGTELSCDDDECGVAAASKVTMDVVSGQDYLIRVAGVRDPGSGFLAGEYRLTIGDCLDNSRRACCGGPNLGICINDTPKVCLGFNGIPQPVGSVCGGSAEACCFPDGSCIEMDPTCCIGQDGTPAGPQSTCLTDINGNGIDEACEGPVDPFTWKDFNGDSPGGYLPDFDQNQDYDNADNDAQPDTGVDQYYGGPTAIADLLWWMSAKYPSLDIVGAGVNSVALIQDLALRMATNGQTPSPWGHPDPYRGTWLDDLATGIRSYLNERDVSDVFDQSVVAEPSFDAVVDQIVADANIALLLGFYEIESLTQIPGSGYLVNWRRSGGHYVAVAGVDETNLQIALSDPDADSAEEGLDGEVRGGDHDHDQDGNANTSIPFNDPSYDHGPHGDKSLASHDIYQAAINEDINPTAPRPIAGGAWMLTINGDPIAYGAELAAHHAASSGGDYLVSVATFMSDAYLLNTGYPIPVAGQTYTVVEAAVVISPDTASQGCCLPNSQCQELSAANCALADGNRTGPDTSCLGDLDISGADDACEPCEPLTVLSTIPPSGTIDARQPHGPGAPLPRAGLGSGDEPIQVILDSSISGLARCLSICESDVDPLLGPNTIKSVTELAPGEYEILLDHPITAGAATSLIYGTGSIDYLAPSANVNTDAFADANDVTSLIDCCLNDLCGPTWDQYLCDIDRSGTVGPADLLRLIDLLGGAAAWTPWDGTALPIAPSCP